MKKKNFFIFAIILITICISNIAIALPALPPIGNDIDPNINTLGGVILGYVRWFGYAIAIGMLIYIGIKYTMSAANEKADLKKGMIAWVIGAIIIAGASTIAGWIFDIVKLEGNNTENRDGYEDVTGPGQLPTK